jgi:hypothetical protein
VKVVEIDGVKYELKKLDWSLTFYKNLFNIAA